MCNKPGLVGTVCGSAGAILQQPQVGKEQSSYRAALPSAAAALQAWAWASGFCLTIHRTTSFRTELSQALKSCGNSDRVRVRLATKSGMVQASPEFQRLTSVISYAQKSPGWDQS